MHVEWMNFTTAAQEGVKGCAVVGVNCVMVEILTHCGTMFFSQNSPLNIHLKLSRYFVEQPKCHIVLSIPTFHMCIYHVNVFTFQTLIFVIDIYM